MRENVLLVIFLQHVQMEHNRGRPRFETSGVRQLSIDGKRPFVRGSHRNSQLGIEPVVLCKSVVEMAGKQAGCASQRPDHSGVHQTNDAECHYNTPQVYV